MAVRDGICRVSRDENRLIGDSNSPKIVAPTNPFSQSCKAAHVPTPVASELVRHRQQLDCFRRLSSEVSFDSDLTYLVPFPSTASTSVLDPWCST